MPRFSVILPAHNEEEAILKVLQDIRAIAPDAEVIVVDDGSTDRTGELAAQNGATVLRHVLRSGAGKSVKDGILQATSDYIVMLDADGSYPVDRIPEFIQQLDAGYDLVIGARRGSEYRGSFLKVLARMVFTFITQFATGKRIPDINSGMRAFRKSNMIPFFQHLCDGFSLPTTMTLSHLFLGKSVTYITISYEKRLGKSKVRIIRDSLRTLQYITESIAYFNPTKLFLLFAIIELLLGLIGGLLFYWWLLFISLFFAVLTFALGLVVYTHRRAMQLHNKN